MNHKEYIIPIGEDAKDYDEMFIAVIRRQPELVRCKDCIYFTEYCRIVDGVTSNHVCSRKREIDETMHRVKADDYCSWAERKEE